ncbi:MAG: DUF418 domain-containing protein [Planctomycetota bacterium]
MNTLIAPEKQRMLSLDVLRGVAILGILPMNILVFCAPFAAYGNPSIYFEGTALNYWIHGVIHVIFDLKMMALFSMLFGAGIAIYDAKSRKDGVDQTAKIRWLWIRRACWLAFFGILHMVFIWEGDILFGYAMTSLVFAWWVRRLPTPWLVAVMGAVLLIHIVLAAGFGWIMHFIPVPGEDATPEQIAQYEESIAFIDPSPAQVAMLEEVYRGGYWGLLQHRLPLIAIIQLGMFPVYMLWRTGGLMLLGILLMRKGVLTGDRSPKFYGLMAAAGYLVGLPLVLGGLYLNASNQWDPMYFSFPGQMPNTIGSIAVMLGHAGLLLWIVRSGVLSTVTGVLAKVGRMAFTNYISQSVICALIFYGYGAGLYGEIDRLGLIGIVAAIWLLQIAWSNAWLSAFRMGPLEWLWRTLTYMKPQPLRLQSGSSEGAPPA